MDENNQNLYNQEDINNHDNHQVQPNKKNNNNFLIVIMAFIIVCLLGYIVYTKFIQNNNSYEPKTDNTQDNSNSQTGDINTQEDIDNNQNIETQDNSKYKNFDEVVTEMKKLPHFEYKIAGEELPKELDVDPLGINDEFHVSLSSDGKIIVKNKDNVSIILNISNVKNIESINRELFILSKNGDLYSYSFDDFANNKDVVTKNNEIRNVTKFVILNWANCTQCGGNTTLGAIDSNNKYAELESFGM